MKPSQKIHNANLSKWTALFRDQSESGLTIKEWCEQNAVSIHAFYYWKRIAKEAYVNSIMPEIVPIPLSSVSLPENQITPSEQEPFDLQSSTGLVPVSPKTLSVSIGDIHIEIGASAKDDTISRIIKAVRLASYFSGSKVYLTFSI